MYVTQDAKKEILKFIEKKIETEEMWAEGLQQAHHPRRTRPERRRVGYARVHQRLHALGQVI